MIKIVEDVEARPAERDGKEVCVGAYSFNGQWLWSSLEKLKAHDTGEYYLTDLVQMATNEGHRVETMQPNDPSEAMGVNDRVDLARVTAIFYERTRKHWMEEGVTLLDPATTFIDGEVEIGIDTVIYPNTSLSGDFSHWRIVSSRPTLYYSRHGDGRPMRRTVIGYRGEHARR